MTSSPLIPIAHYFTIFAFDIDYIVDLAQRCRTQSTILHDYTTIPQLFVLSSS